MPNFWMGLFSNLLFYRIFCALPFWVSSVGWRLIVRLQTCWSGTPIILFKLATEVFGLRQTAIRGVIGTTYTKRGYPSGLSGCKCEVLFFSIIRFRVRFFRFYGGFFRELTAGIAGLRRIFQDLIYRLFGYISSNSLRAVMEAGEGFGFVGTRLGGFFFLIVLFLGRGFYLLDCL